MVSLALLSGCGGSPDLLAHQNPPPVKPVTASALLTKAVTLLRADRTGAFDAVTTSISGGFLRTRQVGGTFDLGRDTWAGKLDLQVSAVGNPRVGGYAAQLAGTGKTLFVNVGKGATAVKGEKATKLGADTWYRATTDTLAIAAADMSLAAVLPRVQAREMRPSGTGGQVVTGTLSAADAVTLLGLAEDARRLKAPLAGTAQVTVALDQAGRIVRFRLAGEDVTFTAKAPRELRDLVAAATYAQSFHSLGSAVKIALPKDATRAVGALGAAARDVL